MTKKLRNGILALATLTMVIGCGACSRQESAGGQGGGTVTVSVWTGNGHDKAFLNEKVAEWNDTVGKELGVKIEYTVQDGNINEKIDLAFTSGQAPDLFGVSNMSKHSENGEIAALEDMPGGPELIAKYEKDIMVGRHRYQGKTYSLPRAVTTYGLLYNKEMFREAGLVDENGEPTPPKTLKELREYAKILTDTKKNQYGIILPGSYSSWYSDDIMKMASASCGMVDGYDFQTGEYDFSGQAAVMETFMGIKEDGSYMPGVEGLTNDAARARFGTGGIGMKTAGSFDFGVYTEQFPAEIEWGVAPFPVADENDTYLQYMNNGGYLMINAASVERVGAEKLMEVYKWFHSDEIMTASYQRGIDIPIDWDLVKDVELGEGLKNWRDFAALVDISASYPAKMPQQMDGEETMKDIWLNRIWPGQVAVKDIADTLAAYGEASNKGVERYREVHPEFDGSEYIAPDLNMKR